MSLESSKADKANIYRYSRLFFHLGCSRPPADLPTDKLKKIVADALDEARKSANLLLLSYMVMPDHYHIITDGKREPSDTLRFLNGISAKRILGYKYSVWEHHADTFLVTSESMVMEAC